LVAARSIMYLLASMSTAICEERVRKLDRGALHPVVCGLGRVRLRLARSDHPPRRGADRNDLLAKGAQL
jgi:hypothetical protein